MSNETSTEAREQAWQIVQEWHNHSLSSELKVINASLLDLVGRIAAVLSSTGEPNWNIKPSPELLSNWPIGDVLKRLAEATTHLLIDHDCDVHGYEELQHAVVAARAYIATPTTEVKQRARPKIICLCGSTRFVDTWISEYQRLSDEGNIVLTCARMPPRPNLQYDEPELKQRLDELHKHKIDLADEVFVLNVNGYIGVSTASEIAHAQARGIPIRYFTSDVKEGGVPRRAEGE